MSDASLKTSILKGNLNRDGSLTNQICNQSTNLTIGLWNICVSNVCLDCKDQTGFFSTVSCNLVSDKRFNSVTKQIETYNPPIATLMLKGRKIVYLEKTWFTINHQCSDVLLFFNNVQTNQKLITDCEITITLLFQRIK
jgi:hypothetical protein